MSDFAKWLAWVPLGTLGLVASYAALVSICYARSVKRPEAMRLADRLWIAQTDFESAKAALDEGKFVNSARRRNAAVATTAAATTPGTPEPEVSSSAKPSVRLISHLEEQTLSLLPVELVRARGFIVLGSLLSSGPEKVLGAQLKVALAAPVTTRDSKTEGVSAQYLRELVVEGTRLLNRRFEATTEETNRWTRRALFLMSALLVGLSCVALTVHTTWAVLLVGALGGLLSRVVVGVAQHRPTSDGRNSWGSLFLAAPVGALAAVAGLLLISLLIAIKILDATTFSAFAKPFATAPQPGPVLGVAFLMGFVERLITSLAQRASGAFDTPPATQPQGSQADTLVANSLVATNNEEAQ